MLESGHPCLGGGALLTKIKTEEAEFGEGESCSLHTGDTEHGDKLEQENRSSAANRLIGEVVQSRRRAFSY